ncbi:MAG: bifunctional UDP-N-acetylglucosamine diphosphorylase/glucosamine-1-phosphate N-acetyltransferase GlmU [Elusimicrobiota bacterium]|nr:bifunctional UDP-N-acetylglucosamine diphosphorylase/glucosamine-1-phosphate N-acetyltransferase GlmU [Elusimicrobiota bacterium]
MNKNNQNKNIISIILGAGKGARMKSNIPKILHLVNNKPLIYWLIKSIQIINPLKNILVVGHQYDEIKNYFQTNKELSNLFHKNQPSGILNFAFQERLLGSGDAVKSALNNIDKNYDGDILVVCGDTPLLTSETISNLIENHKKTDSAVTVLTAKVENPFGYGRVKKDKNNNIIKIIEEKDSDFDEKNIKEINSGVYCFKYKILKDYIHKIVPNEKTAEFYLTDIIEIIYKTGVKTKSFATDNLAEILGINDKVALFQANREMRMRINKKFMLQGVEIINPENIEIDENAKIGIDTIIYDGTIIRGKVEIGDNCKIETNSFIENSKIGNNTSIKYSYIIDSFVGNNCEIGPFSHIRPNTKIDDNCKIGNFTEIKNTYLAKGTKVSHLSYIGDSELGENVNIGAGTITCNYDGINKYKTIIKDNSFIGSNTNLIAPVIIGKNSIIGAGSTIYEDVPDNSLGIERNKQINKKLMKPNHKPKNPK